VNKALSALPTRARAATGLVRGIGAHEFIHRITGVGDLPYNQNMPNDLMSLNKNPNFYSVLPNNGLELTAPEGQKLLEKCLKKPRK
jgi:hypothetical protein